MGQVYLARDLSLDREVAIKFISGVDVDSGARGRFLTEARGLARLQHPNVVAVHRIGEVSRRPYLVSEFVDGQPLDKLQKPVPWQRALAIGLDLARGLAAAHRRGVLHRDLKPANAMISKDGAGKLLDFGLAELMDDAVSRTGPATKRPVAAPPRPVEDVDATRSVAPVATASPEGAAAAPATAAPSGERVGTPMYMAPEVWRGDPATRRSDVYSLGILLYELVAGRAPFKHASGFLELETLILAGDMRPIGDAAPGIDPGLAAVVTRCVARDPAARFASGDALLDALERIRRETGGAPAPEGNPYRGLAAFGEEHRALFFGRTTEVREVAERLRAEPFVLVAGDSGVGKSSLCRAGVLPILRDAGWRVVTLMPGRDPMAALRAAVGDVPADADAIGDFARALGKLVVCVDQLEELVTVAPAAGAAAFAEALAALATSRTDVHVLATVRGDYVTRVAALPALGELVSRALHILRPLAGEGLREAVAGPARAAGYALEDDGLIDKLVATAGSLPLLQFTLAAMWDRRDEARRLVPARALAELGGVAGALARHADGVIDGLLPDERAAAWRALGRLVTHEGTRAVLTRAELDEVARAPGVVERLVAARLVVASEARVALVHEALIAAWPRFVAWRRDNAEGARLRDQLGDAARQWEARGRPRGLLWRADALTEYKLWRARHADALTAGEDAFASASVADAARGRRRLRLGVGVLVVGLAAVAVVLAVLARRAQQGTTEARDSLATLHLEQARQALHAGNPLHALVFLSEVRRHAADTPALRLLEAQALRPVLAERHRLVGHAGIVWSARISPDGATIATAGQDGTLRLWDAATGKAVHVIDVKAGPVWRAEWSLDGQTVATIGPDADVRLWDARAGTLRARLTGQTSELARTNELAFSPDGATFAVTDSSGRTRLYALSGAHLRDLAGHDGALRPAQFDATGGRLVSVGRDDRKVIVWDTRSGQVVRAFPPASVAVTAAVLAPDDRLVVGHLDGTVQVVAVGEGRVVSTSHAHTAEISHIKLSRDGRRFLTASFDRTARVWDADGRLVATLLGHSGPIHAAAFAPDGTRVYTGSSDGTARSWDAQDGTELMSFAGHASAVRGLDVSVDGGALVTAGFDGTARLWSARAATVDTFRTGGQLDRGGLGGDTLLARGMAGAVLWHRKSGDVLLDLPGGAACFDATGARLATADAQGTYAIRDAAGRPVHTWRGEPVAVTALAFGPDGGSLIAGDLRGTARIWDVASGTTRAILATDDGAVEHVVLGRTRALTQGGRGGTRLWDTAGRQIAVLDDRAVFDPDGSLVVGGGSHRLVKVWSAATGALVAELAGHTAQVLRALFSPDGRFIASASQDGSVKIWDVRTRTLVSSLEHASSVLWVSYSDDGSLLVSATYDGTVRVWDTTRFRPLAVLRGHTKPVLHAQLTKDSSAVISASWDHSVKVWVLPRETAPDLTWLVTCKLGLALEGGVVVPATSVERCGRSR